VSEPYLLQTDGGARGNPGPAGVGFVLVAPGGDVVTAGGRYLGETTNNVAEYEALIWGLETARSRGITPLVVQADSELVVKQMNGVYRVKNAGLRPLYERACQIRSAIGDVRFVHVRREHNKLADGLANEAMDARATVGDAVWPVDAAGQTTLFE